MRIVILSVLVSKYKQGMRKEWRRSTSRILV